MTEPTLHEWFPATHDWLDVSTNEDWFEKVCTVCGCEVSGPMVQTLSIYLVIPPCRGSARVEITGATDAAKELLTKKRGP